MINLGNIFFSSCISMLHVPLRLQAFTEVKNTLKYILSLKYINRILPTFTYLATAKNTVFIFKLMNL